jgi:hypothetical protein
MASGRHCAQLDHLQNLTDGGVWRLANVTNELSALRAFLGLHRPTLPIKSRGRASLGTPAPFNTGWPRLSRQCPEARRFVIGRGRLTGVPRSERGLLSLRSPVNSKSI